MNFSQFESGLEALRFAENIGESAHAEIFPEIAQYRKDELRKNPNPRLSAVAAIIFPAGDETSLLLIERQTYDGVHSGQIGFPGGKVEAFDTSLENTARRETQEEVGIPGETLELVKELSQVYIPPSGFLVHPFLFTLKYTPELILDPREVQTALVLPVERLLADNTLIEGNIPTANGVSLQTKYFQHANKKIWGATAMMLAELKILLKQLNAN